MKYYFKKHRIKIFFLLVLSKVVFRISKQPKITRNIQA